MSNTSKSSIRKVAMLFSGGPAPAANAVISTCAAAFNKRGIEAIKGLKVLGQPHLSIVAYGSDEFDVFRVAELMAKQGWLPGLLQRPKAIHRMMSMVHAPSLDEYLADLRAAIDVVRRAGTTASQIQATY